MLTDTHAHLYWEDFKEDFDQMLQRSKAAGVTTLINVGVDVKLSKKALDQVRKTNWPSGMNVYSTIGIHPHESSTFSPDQINTLEEIYNQDPKKVVAVGECGLDYVEITDEEKNLQRKLFQAQIDLAKKLNLPLIVHCRDDRSKNPNNSEGWDEVLKMLGNSLAILHCYSGLPHTTNSILHSANLSISFAATITYPKNQYLREAAKILPLDRIVLETDCPFLPPQSKRGQRNEPSSVLEIAKLIAELKGVSLEEVTHQTGENVKMIFKF